MQTKTRDFQSLFCYKKTTKIKQTILLETKKIYSRLFKKNNLNTKKQL